MRTLTGSASFFSLNEESERWMSLAQTSPHRLLGKTAMKPSSSALTLPLMLRQLVANDSVVLVEEQLRLFVAGRELED